MIQFENAINRFKQLILDELKTEGVNCWIAGGCLRDYYMGLNKKTDIDLFFPNEEEFIKTREYMINSGGSIVWESDNGVKISYKNNIYDLIKIYFDNPQKTIEEFDFTVSMIALDNHKVYHGETTFIDLAKRQIIINKISYPASTLLRAFKYQAKGFAICKSELKKMIDAIYMSNRQVVNDENSSEESRENNNMSSAEMFDFFIGID